MAARTFVSMTVRNDRLEEGRQALWTLVTGPFGPVEVYRSNAPDAFTTIVTSLPGDVRDEVKEQLDSITDLEYEVELRSE